MPTNDRGGGPAGCQRLIACVEFFTTPTALVELIGELEHRAVIRAHVPRSRNGPDFGVTTDRARQLTISHAGLPSSLKDRMYALLGLRQSFMYRGNSPSRSITNS